MLSALSKPADELTPQDIDELISRDVQEGEHVEFKRGLSSSGQSGQTPGRTKITDDDKRSLVKEIVAFANAYSGRIFLGIEENNDEPPTAKAINPIPDCTNLAERLSRSCADSIDPPMIRLLHVVGIQTQPDGSGVIVFDVPRSTRAPHMSQRDNRAYRRRGSESVPMDMRDVQDMTLRSASRSIEIEAEFDRRRIAFVDWTKNFRSASEQPGYCLRLSFVPLDEVDIGRVHSKPEVAPQFVGLSGTIKQEKETSVGFIYPDRLPYLNPVVRGTRLTNNNTFTNFSFDSRLWENGGLEVWIGRTERFDPNLPLAWLGWLLANGLRNVERIRRYANLPLLSYRFVTQLIVYDGPMILKAFGDNSIRLIEPRLPTGDHVMPPHEVEAVASFDDIVTQYFTDWFNLAGEEWDAEISVDYRLD